MTDIEARRARQRAYSAAYRARQREQLEDALDADPDEVEPGPMLTAVDTSVAAMRWLEDSDEALVVLTRQQAAQIDALLAVGTPAARGQATRAQSQLLRSLQALGGTPVVRLQHELRSRRLEAVAARTAGWQGAPVSSITRPPRRR